MTKQQIPKLVAGLVEHQSNFALLSVEDGQWVIQNTVEAIGLFLAAVGNRGKQVVNAVAETAKKAIVYLRRLYEAEKIEIGATDGTETFVSPGLFTGGVYGVDLSGVAGKPTPATKATVWEMILDGIFAQLFGSLGEARRRWTQAQVVEFCRLHRDKLRTEGYATFFELEGGFVASVYVDDDGRLEVDVCHFSDDDVWYAEYRHRIVVPQ